MHAKVILNNILKHIDLSEEEKLQIISFLKIQKVKRKQILLRANEIQKYNIFVASGCLRSYLLDQSGVEHVLQFAPFDWWIGDLFSLKCEEPSKLYIDAICDSEIFLLSNSDLDKLYTTIPKLERCFRLLSERAFAIAQRRIIDIMSLSAQERYKNFQELYPDLSQKLPKKMIASYIGVTPEFFSRMTHQLPNTK